MYWLKNNAGKMHITEKSAEEYLRKCREAQETVKVDMIPYGCTDLRMTAMPRVMPKV